MRHVALASLMALGCAAHPPTAGTSGQSPTPPRDRTSKKDAAPTVVTNEADATVAPPSDTGGRPENADAIPPLSMPVRPDAAVPLGNARLVHADTFDDGVDETRWQNIWTTDWWISTWMKPAPTGGINGTGAMWLNTLLPAGGRQRDVLVSFGRMALWGEEVAPLMKPRDVAIIKNLVASGKMMSGPAPLKGIATFTMEADLKFAADNRNRGGFLFKSASAVPFPSGDSVNAYRHVIQYDGYAFVVSNHVFPVGSTCEGMGNLAIAGESNVFIVKRQKATMEDRHNDLPYTLIARARHPIPAETWIRLRLEVDGLKFKGYIDGQLVIEGTDPKTDFADRHHVGLHGYKHQKGNDWDCYAGNLLTSFHVDNFAVYEGIPPLVATPGGTLTDGSR